MTDAKSTQSKGNLFDRLEQTRNMQGLLAAVVDPALGDGPRLAAIRDIQRMLPPDHRLARRRPDDLLDDILPPWATRLYRDPLRELPVTRPPAQCSDVWA